MHDQIAETKIAVRDGGLIVRRNVHRQPFDEPIHFGNRIDDRGLVLFGPARDLPRDVRLRTAVVAKPNRVVIDFVQARHHLVHRIVNAGALLAAQARQQRVDKDAPLDIIHHEERSADDALIDAQQMGARDRQVGVRERGQNAIFALDLMRRLQQRTGRLLAHDVARVAGAQHEGWIRLASRELHHLERAAEARQFLDEILFRDALRRIYDWRGLQ